MNRINPSDFTIEAFTVIGYVPKSMYDTLHGLEYDSRRNVFWATALESQQLIRIDPETFQATVIGQFPRTAYIGGLAYDRATDTLYGVEDFAAWWDHGIDRSQLVTINVSSLAITSIGPFGLGLELNDLDSLAFDPVGRFLYSINDERIDTETPRNQQLVRIDPTSGIATAIGSLTFTHEHYQGLTFIVPEPASIRLLACFAAAVMLCRRRFFDSDKC